MTTAYTYEDYLNESQHITFERMADIHRRLVAAIDLTIDTDHDCYTDLITAAAIYANIRASWCTMSREEKQEKDSRRTSAHDSFIRKLDILERYLAGQDKDTSWRDDLGHDTDGYGRKAIGDFACYLAFVEGINAR